MAINIGTAGWSIPRDVAEHFPAEGTSLERYAARFPVAEINSSFHRSHRASTWERWGASVPAGFRFSAKLPKTITHVAKLRDCTQLIDGFLAEVAGLGPKLAVLLVQLPPETHVRCRYWSLASSANCRPGQPFRSLASRATPAGSKLGADELLNTLQIARVAADPACCPGADQPGGWRGLDYWRLHGSPVNIPIELRRPHPRARQRTRPRGRRARHLVHFRQYRIVRGCGRRACFIG